MRLSATEKFAFLQVIKLKVSQGSVFIVDGGTPTLIEMTENS